MKRNIIGFRPSWMEGEPVEIVTEDVAECVPPPDELIQLRYKIAQMATFMASVNFGKMRKDERVDLILEFTELNSIESGYSRAVNNK
jgi:hypothetical protein